LFAVININQMKKLYPFLFVLATPVILLIMSNSSGSIGGKTGSIGDNGSTCTECHAGSATPIAGWITTNIPSDGYTPGQTYTITATGTHSGVVKFGFELTVENSQGSKVGTLQISDPGRTKLVNSNKAVTHTSAGTVPFGNTNSWTMNWVAPAGVDGEIGIYAAFNAANGNGNTGGDVVYKSSTFIAEYIPNPTLISIIPDSALQGETFTASIFAAETRFTETTPDIFLNFSDNQLEIIPATSVNVINDITVEAVFTIPANASPGTWHVNVDDLVLENAFSVILVSGIIASVPEQLSVYPNPASERFYVNDVSGSEISLYSLTGERITSLIGSSDKEAVDVSNLPDGLYVVKVKNNDGERIAKLLVN
jgi:hypothetical protein